MASPYRTIAAHSLDIHIKLVLVWLTKYNCCCHLTISVKTGYLYLHVDPFVSSVDQAVLSDVFGSRSDARPLRCICNLDAFKWKFKLLCFLQSLNDASLGQNTGELIMAIKTKPGRTQQVSRLESQSQQIMWPQHRERLFQGRLLSANGRQPSTLWFQSLIPVINGGADHHALPAQVTD